VSAPWWRGGDRTLKGLALALVLSVAVAALQYASVTRLLASSRQSTRGFEVLAQAELVAGELSGASSAQRAYLLTGNPDFQRYYAANLDCLVPDLRQLARLAAGDPGLAARVARLAPLVLGRAAELRRLMALRQSAGQTEAVAAIDAAAAQLRTRPVRSEIAAIRAQVLSRVAEREREVAHGTLLSLLACGFGLLLALALVAVTVGLSRRDLAQRVRAGAQEEEANRLSAIIAAQSVIAADFRRGRVAELVTEQVRGLTGAAGAMVVLEDEEPLQRPAAAAGAWVDAVAAAPVVAVLDDRGQVTDAFGHPVAAPSPDLFARMGARALVIVPLVCLGRRLGEVRVFSPAPVVFSVKVIADLQLLAGFAAAALSHAAELEAKEAALRELRRAKETADSSSLAKSEFLASMSHELRTPLNSVLGFSEILRDQRFGLLNPRQLRYIDNVLSSGRHLLRLVSDVLDLSKVESGRMELHLAAIDLRAALADAIAIVQALAQAKHLEISLSLPPRRPPLVADPGKFKQILYNLLSNAVKFTPYDGKVRIEARSLAESAPALGGEHGMLLISVVDNGVGIPHRDQLRIFEAFEQVASPVGREQPGTGLGLALARQLVELHGGRIWVESAGADRGSCFRFTLPLTDESAYGQLPAVRQDAAQPVGPAYDQSLQPQGPAGASAVHQPAPLVLVVEDDPYAREVIRLSLRNAGYDVVEAGDGDQALAIARVLRPQAITLDLMLPGRDGWEVLAELRRAPATRDIPVIVVSISEECARAERLGAQAHMLKPVDRELLVALVREVTGAEWRAVDD
jgi:signal transduction histidine kinase/ActR/RegA family two-component response regulator